MVWAWKTVAVFWLIGLALILPGCGGKNLAKDVFTNPTGNITIPRQDFVNSYALVKVLWKDIRHNAELTCVRGPEEQMAPCLIRLREIDAQAKQLAYNIDAKIATPESEIDWAVVMGLLKAIVSLVP